MNSDRKDKQYDRFMSLFVGKERAIRAYVRSLLSSSQEVDDLMQDIGLACWHKFDQFDPDGSSQDFIRWCCVISRFEVLRFRRSRARDRVVLSEDAVQLLASDAEDRLQRSEEERQALKACLRKLNDSERRLLLSVHTRGDSISRIATETNQKTRRLYSKVNALRDLIADCVRTQMAPGEI
jgi:RNA polymerase sigma-70 factor (ECF subfamily)